MINLISFTLGIISFYIIYLIAYKIFWYSFKLKGKRKGLQTKKCVDCHNRFYTMDFETTDTCCNCILLSGYEVVIE